MKAATLALTLTLLTCLPRAAHADSLSVTNTAFGVGIEDHAVTGVDTSFSQTVGRLYFWALVANAHPGDTVYHVWSIRGWTSQRICIPVQGYRFRTHSVKTLGEKMAGRWSVHVEDKQGHLLAADSVTVRAN
jgi:hypothetical protein